MTLPLLELEQARIDGEGRCVLESVTFTTSGERIGLLGQGNALLDALAGTAELTSGRFHVGGIELAEAQKSALYAVARPWPGESHTTVREGLIFSALLGGCTPATAKRHADRALESLGLELLGRQKLIRRPKVEAYLAGLAEAALFEPEIVVVDWPIGLLDAQAWVRFGMTLARLVNQKRWIAWVPGPARLPVEQSWIGALDQLIWVDNDASVDIGAPNVGRVRTLVVIDGALEELPEGLDREALRLERVRLASPFEASRTAFLVELERDEFGRPDTEPLLGWCDLHGLPLVRLEPLDRGF